LASVTRPSSSPMIPNSYPSAHRARAVTRACPSPRPGQSDTSWYACQPSPRSPSRGDLQRLTGDLLLWFARRWSPSPCILARQQPHGFPWGNSGWGSRSPARPRLLSSAVRVASPADPTTIVTPTGLYWQAAAGFADAVRGIRNTPCRVCLENAHRLSRLHSDSLLNHCDRHIPRALPGPSHLAVTGGYRPWSRGQRPHLRADGRHAASPWSGARPGNIPSRRGATTDSGDATFWPRTRCDT